MKTTIKLAAIGAAALAVSSTSALALSELPAGVTTGIALGAALPEGVYDISIASYGSANSSLGNLAYSIPVWLIWSTPWSIAGGRIAFDTATGVADVWTAGSTANGTDSWLNTLVEASIAWNLHNGFNVSLRAGAWLPSTQALPETFARDYTAFQGGGSVSYIANGWNLTATGLYGSGHDGNGNSYGGTAASRGIAQNSWFNLDMTATKKLGKMEIGVVAYGSWDVDSKATDVWVKNGSQAKAKEFAVGGLVGYDFGSFIAQAKLTGDVEAENIIGRNATAVGIGGEKEVRGTLTIIKPLWNPEAAPLK
jgi:hypothetical protein